MCINLDVDAAAVAKIEAVPAILKVICGITDMGFAAVVRITEDRWIACEILDHIKFGLRPGGELEIATIICRENKNTREPVVIDDMAKDPVYRRRPTPALDGIQSYISMPIILPDGTLFGTLCALSPHPSKLNTPEVVGMFRLFAELIATHLGVMRRVAAVESSLMVEQENAALREEFIAVLGHDLRSPLSAIKAGMQLLERTPLTEKASSILGMVRTSINKMAGLIDNVMDFAHGRLGSGITLQRSAQAIEPVLTQIISELQVACPGRVFAAKFDLPGEIDCDVRRIGQVFSNLLTNAATYSPQATPIRSIAVCTNGMFELTVSNGCEPLPHEVLERLFLPYTRGATKANQQGLGLGLYICGAIAQAHGGRMEVSSTPVETRFTFRIPLI
jgi:signal transduction histidine kinase